MFWSKIWLFLLAAVAAIAITIALLLPRPAQRARIDDDRQRLVVACDVVNIQLKSAARSQIDVAGAFARQSEVVAALERTSAAETIDEASSKAARELIAQTIAGVAGTRPDFAILIDRRGRVLARAGAAGIDSEEFGDTMAGRFLVDDALAGYLRDDLWQTSKRLYRVAASPVVRRDPPQAYVGAVVVGNSVSKQFAEDLVRPLGATVGFYVKGDAPRCLRNAFDGTTPSIKVIHSIRIRHIPNRLTCQSRLPLQPFAKSSNLRPGQGERPGHQPVSHGRLQSHVGQRLHEVA